MLFDKDNKKVSFYTKDKGYVEVILSDNYFSDLLSMDYIGISEGLERDGLKDKDGITFEEYLYLCLTFFEKGFDFSSKDYKKLTSFKKYFLEGLEYLSFIDDFLDRSKNVISLDFEINSELIDALKKNMNPNYNSKERIVYYYFKLCFLLEADVHYNFCNLISSFSNKINYEKSSNNLANITPSNNQVCCFEFDEIMKKLIEEENGVVLKYKFSGSSQHVCTKSVIDKSFMMLDAFENPVNKNVVGRDIINVRVNRGYNGVVLNSDALLYGVIDNFSWVDKIYNDVQKEFDFCRSDSKFSQEQLKACFDIVDNINIDIELKNRIKTYFLEINKYPFAGVSFFGNVTNSHIVLKEDKEKIALTGVCSYFDDCGLDVVMSIKQDDGKMIYFVFGDNMELNAYCSEEIEQMIYENKIIITHREILKSDGENLVLDERYFFIPGISESVQKEGNRRAEDNLLPKVFKRIYQKSSGENETVYIKS